MEATPAQPGYCDYLTAEDLSRINNNDSDRYDNNNGDNSSAPSSQSLKSTPGLSSVTPAGKTI